MIDDHSRFTQSPEHMHARTFYFRIPVITVAVHKYTRNIIDVDRAKRPREACCHFLDDVHNFVRPALSSFSSQL